ncbi:heat shock protein Hsp15 [Salinisphaera hydrothermalis EPR70]
MACQSLDMNQASRKSESTAAPAVRVDKWLWAARFFKTRSLASTAVKGGKVEIDGHKAKPSANVRAGQQLRITKGEVVFEIDIVDVSDKRGPATQAETLYSETEASRERRAERAAERRAARISMPRPTSRPDKKQRRQLRRFKHGD